MTTEQTNEESGVMQAMRQQLKEAKRDLAEKDRQLESARAEGYRDAHLEHALESLGQPMSIKGLVADALGDEHVDTGSVEEALRGLGFNPQKAVSAPQDAPGAPEGSKPVPEAPMSDEIAGLRDVTNLSSQVQAAASQPQVDSFYDGLNKTESPEELANFMRQQGMGS